MMASKIEKATNLWQLDKDKEAIELLSSLNLEEHARANTLIGKILIGAEKGVSNIKKDTKKGITYLEKGFLLGDPDAGLELADIYYYGNGVRENKKKAEKYWNISYELGDALAGFELANYYFDIDHQKINIAIKIYEDLISRNEFTENSYYKLYEIYEKGIGGITPQKDVSMKYLEQGANLSHIHCCMNLGLKLYRGEGVVQDKNKAIEIVRRVENHEFFKEEVSVILTRMLNQEKI